jgi:hypothetical protein
MKLSPWVENRHVLTERAQRLGFGPSGFQLLFLVFPLLFVALARNRSSHLPLQRHDDQSRAISFMCFHAC